MKLVIIKKGTKKWTAAGAGKENACCVMMEGSYLPCFEIGLNG